MNRHLIFVLFLSLLAVPSLSIGESSAPSDKIQVYRNLAQNGQLDEAFRLLETQFNAEKDLASKARWAVGLGIRAFQKNEMVAAEHYLNESLNLKTRLDDYAQYHLGLIAAQNKNYELAKNYFEQVRAMIGGSIYVFKASRALAKLYMDQKKWREAQALLLWLEKKSRRDAQYSEILQDLIFASLKMQQRSQACRFVSKFYSKFAAESLALGWTMDLKNAEIQGEKLGCIETAQDLERRFKSLLMSGLYDEAQKDLELQEGRIKLPKGMKSDIPAQLLLKKGQLFLARGQVKDALNILVRASESLPNNFTVASLLAKAYARSDQYLPSVEWYMRAYRMAPRSKQGRLSLFQAAFLSYQNRDYDGAALRFGEFVKKFPRTSMAADGRWHLAWMKYLRKDFDGAIKSFEELSHQAKGVDLEKVTYWRAMSYLRLSQPLMARVLFELLSKQKRLGYYTAASFARLQEIPKDSKNLPLLSSNDPFVKAVPKSLMVGANDFRLPLAQPTPQPAPLTPNTAAMGSGTGTAAGGDPQRMPQSVDVALERGEAETETFEPIGAAQAAENSAEEDEKDKEEGAEDSQQMSGITAFKDPRLLKRFDKATDLLILGMEDWARLELREIEKLTSNKGYLQTLMYEYAKTMDYHRGAYLADVIFSSIRESGGFEKAMDYWQIAFPQAFHKQVAPVSKRFDVPSALVWSIMRAESTFKSDVRSPAGALGLMQLIPPTAFKIAEYMSIKSFRAQDLLTPETNILFGTWYLKRLNKLFDQHLPLAIAGYNAGPHRVQGWLKDFGVLDMDEFVEHIPYLETRNYTKKVLRNFFIYKYLYEKQLNPVSFLAKKVAIKFDGPKPDKENWDPL